MRPFHCPHCGASVRFEAQRCPSCSFDLGYLPEALDVVLVHPTDRPGIVTAAQDPADRWRCLNAAWGCNWVLTTDSGTEWCASCRLTRGRPDGADPSAVDAWSHTEALKRRLLHQLASVGLPIDGRTSTRPEGLVFELVHVPGAPAVTGHLGGVVTIDLTEADDSRREQLRHQLGEGTRTMLGHLRHEIGHYYWPHLVATDAELDEFRRLFGDERDDYRRAMQVTPSERRARWDRGLHISAYATAHPAEDWAESFAHYLLVTDAVETARAGGLVAGPATWSPPSILEAVEEWRALAGAIDAVAESVGAAPLYPFSLTPRVVEKLAFVERCVLAHR